MSTASQPSTPAEPRSARNSWAAERMQVTESASREITTVLSTVPFGGEHLERLRRAFASATFIHTTPDDAATIEAALQDAEVAVLAADLDRRFVEAPRLRWVHCDHAGLTRSAMPDVFEKGLIVTSSAGRSSPALAQHVFFFALGLAYDVHALQRAQQAHQWRGIPGYEERRALWGKTMGIVGFGHTGQALAPMAKAFGMEVLVYRRSAAERPEHVDEVYSAEAGDGLDELLRRSDVLVLAASLSDRTHHLIGSAELARMKRAAYLVNISRGPVVDEAALVRALHEGTIAGAGLDVFETEPLPPDAPIWDAPNVVITPHMTPAVPDKIERSLEVICDNVQRFRAGQPLRNQLEARDIYTKG